ncbi:MAG: Uma2 family endonuclease [Planctomycetota bacterium]
MATDARTADALTKTPETERPAREWNAADLVDLFGPIPMGRVRTDPSPGTATFADFEHECVVSGKVSCELVDGVLVEKAMSWQASFIAGEILALLRNFIQGKGLGILLTADGALRLRPDLVRMPDVSFIDAETLREKFDADVPYPRAAPTLAVEVLSLSNTAREMERKVSHYLENGTRSVWVVDPRKRTVAVHSADAGSTLLTESDRLTGGDVLPGFDVAVADLFIGPDGGNPAA